MDYTFAGNAMPKRAEYDGVCRLCARDGVRGGGLVRDSVLLVFFRGFQLNSSLPCQKSIPPVAAAILRRTAVWQPVSVRDRPWQHDSTSPTHRANVRTQFL